MQHHPYFDLWLHDDDELRPFVQSAILERRTLHEWPLSCVQRLTLADGRALIYKVQHVPTVEPAFYARARSDLLVPARTILQNDRQACMLLDYLAAPMLRDLTLTESQAVAVGRQVMERIAKVEGDPPCLLDISSQAKWGQAMDAVWLDLRELIDAGRFKQVDPRLMRQIEQPARSQPVLAAIRAAPGLAHGDLTAANVFVLPEGGHRVIDWQHVKCGPPELDLATLLESLGHDPRAHVNEGVVRIMYLLRIRWFAECAMRWFPAGGATYDREIARLATCL